MNQRITQHVTRNTQHASRNTHHNSAWDVLRLVHFIFLVILALFLIVCTVRCGEDLRYGDAAAWVAGYALPSERVAIPASAARDFCDLDALPLPVDADAFALLAALQTALPDVVVAWPGVAWDGVRAQPWFQAHYRLLEVVGQGHATLHIFGYAPSPFDAGASMQLRQALGTGGFALRAVRVGQRRLTPGEPLYVTLFWRGDPFALPDAHRLVLRLVDAGEAHVLAQVEHTWRDGVPANLLREGDDLLSHDTLAVPDDLSAGAYRLTLTIYRRNGSPVAGENLTLAQLYRPPAVTREAPTPDFDGDWRLGDAIALVGYDAPSRVSTGGMLRVALYWHALDRVPGDDKVFVHLMDAAGNLVAQHDAVPLDWSYPTTQWQPGEYIRDVHVLVLDNAVPRGDYTLFVGMYDAATGTRLDVAGAQGEHVPDGRIKLRVVSVR